MTRLVQIAIAIAVVIAIQPLYSNFIHTMSTISTTLSTEPN